MKKEYEVMFIFNARQKIYEETKEQIETLFKEFNVDIFDQVDLGVKKFSYEIKKQQQGHYYVYYINVEGVKINQMNKELKLKESLLRHMFVHMDKFAKQHYLKKNKENTDLPKETINENTEEAENSLSQTPSSTILPVPDPSPSET